MIKLIVFDYDGVIVDSFPKVHEVYKIMCKELGKKCPRDLEGFKKIYGHSSSDCLKQLGISEKDRAECGKIYKREILKKNPLPFKGIDSVLKKLHKEYKLVLISSSYKDEVIQKLSKFNLINLFDHIIAKESHSGRFEKTKSIKKVLNYFKLKEHEVLLIGDRNIDFIEGNKAGLSNIILVDYGWGYDLSLIPKYKPIIHVKKPEDILEAIKKI